MRAKKEEHPFAHFFLQIKVDLLQKWIDPITWYCIIQLSVTYRLKKHWLTVRIWTEMYVMYWKTIVSFSVLLCSCRFVFVTQWDRVQPVQSDRFYCHLPNIKNVHTHKALWFNCVFWGPLIDLWCDMWIVFVLCVYGFSANVFEMFSEKVIFSETWWSFW